MKSSSVPTQAGKLSNSPHTTECGSQTPLTGRVATNTWKLHSSAMLKQRGKQAELLIPRVKVVLGREISPTKPR